MITITIKIEGDEDNVVTVEAMPETDCSVSAAEAGPVPAELVAETVKE